jgi:hypothetical protein
MGDATASGSCCEPRVATEVPKLACMTLIGGEGRGGTMPGSLVGTLLQACSAKRAGNAACSPPRSQPSPPASALVYFCDHSASAPDDPTSTHPLT